MIFNLYHHPLLRTGQILRPKEPPNTTMHWTFDGKSTVQWYTEALRHDRRGEARTAENSRRWRIAKCLEMLDTKQWIYDPDQPEEVMP